MPPPNAVAAETAALAEEKPTDPPAPTPEQAERAAPKFPKPGFSEVKVINKVPICVFPNYEEQDKADHLDQVERKKLRAGQPVIFGAFAPWCVHETCDQRPSLQCEVKQEGNTLFVHTKYWGDHKAGSSCTDVCRPINAGCKSAELKAGKYTVVHGQMSFEIKIPGTPATPCLGELLPPGG